MKHDPVLEGCRTHPLLQGYELLTTLGAGSYGRVFLACKKQNGTMCAIKFIEIRDNQEWLKRELLAFELEHKNIVKFIDYFPREVDKQLFIEMQLYPQKSLKLAMNNGIFITKREYLSQVVRGMLEGLAFIHEEGFIHRDIKPDNILLTSSFVPKIADFGLVKKLGTRSTLTPGQGTHLYMAPEVESDYYNNKVDVFSMGLVVFELIISLVVDTEDNRLKFVEQFLEKGFPDEFGEGCSNFFTQNTKDFVIAMVKKNAFKRCRARDVLEKRSEHLLLQDPFLMKTTLQKEIAQSAGSSAERMALWKDILQLKQRLSSDDLIQILKECWMQLLYVEESRMNEVDNGTAASAENAIKIIDLALTATDETTSGRHIRKLLRRRWINTCVLSTATENAIDLNRERDEYLARVEAVFQAADTALNEHQKYRAQKYFTEVFYTGEEQEKRLSKLNEEYKEDSFSLTKLTPTSPQDTPEDEKTTKLETPKISFYLEPLTILMIVVVCSVDAFFFFRIVQRFSSGILLCTIITTTIKVCYLLVQGAILANALQTRTGIGFVNNFTPIFLQRYAILVFPLLFAVIVMFGSSFPSNDAQLRSVFALWIFVGAVLTSSPTYLLISAWKSPWMRAVCVFAFKRAGINHRAPLGAIREQIREVRSGAHPDNGGDIMDFCEMELHLEIVDRTAAMLQPRHPLLNAVADFCGLRSDRTEPSRHSEPRVDPTHRTYEDKRRQGGGQDDDLKLIESSTAKKEFKDKSFLKKFRDLFNLTFSRRAPRLGPPVHHNQTWERQQWEAPRSTPLVQQRRPMWEYQQWHAPPRLAQPIYHNPMCMYSAGAMHCPAGLLTKTS